MPLSSPFDCLALLRAATRPTHDELEASSWIDGVTTSLDAYGRHIARIEALYREAERRSQPHAAALAEYELLDGYRPALERLGTERDRLSDAGFVLDPAPDCSLPVMTSASHAAASAYVLRGSVLGGLLIAGMVRDRLGWESPFYLGSGGATAAEWRRFCAGLRAASALFDPPALVIGAQAMFAAFRAHVIAPA